MTLHEIERRAQAFEEAKLQLRLAVIQAHADGLPVAACARAAGVTRTTIYTWLSEVEHEL